MKCEEYTLNKEFTNYFNDQLVDATSRFAPQRQTTFNL